MQPNKAYLILGECGSCRNSARDTLRLCGLQSGVDYVEVNRFEFRKDVLFQINPTLYVMNTAVFYRPDKNQFINLKNIKLTNESRQAIASMVE